MRTNTTSIATLPRHLRAALAAALLALAALGFAAPSQALGAPELGASSTHTPAAPVPAGTHARYAVTVSNAGDASTSGPITVHFSVPAGVEVVSAADENAELLEELGYPPFWECTIAGGAQSASCTGIEDPLGFFGGETPVGPGQEACVGTYGRSCRIFVTVKSDSNATPGAVHPAIEACGGGAASCATALDDPFEIVPFDFHVAEFDAKSLLQNGDPATQAGGHPYSNLTEFVLSTGIAANGYEDATEELKDATASLPPGFIGNPQALDTCALVQLANQSCPPESQAGVVNVQLDGRLGYNNGHPFNAPAPIYNMKVPFGLPAVFSFEILSNITMVYAELRTGEDYGIDVSAKNAPQTLPIRGLDFEFWGVPADSSHDAERECGGLAGPGCASAFALRPFLSLPTSCEGTGPNNSVETGFTMTSWQGGEASSSILSHDNTLPTPNPVGFDGCNAVDFSPSLEARPTTNVADSASGLDVDLHIPQHEKCAAGPPVSCENAEAHLKDTTVTLPEGLVVNPSSANGLGACSEAQFGFTGKEGDTIHTTPGPAACPDASRLGTVEVGTPLLDHPLKGAAYLAAPHANPFNSLLALYIAVDDPQTGVVVKLAGEVHADPATGRLTTTVLHNPQLPFEDFRLHFFGGSGGALRTPAACGSYSTTSSMTPWTAPDSGPPATPEDTWALTQAPGGGACPASEGARPNSPDLDAGSVSPIAAAHSPAVVNLRRNDGSQEFSTVSLTLPPGMTGKLAGVGQCPDSALAAAAQKTGNQEKASPSCPASSRIGTVEVAAGAGPAPYNTQGTAYLTPPYKGAPLGMAIITPATAGPFDLGTVVVRVALHLDPTSGQITAVSDPIPHILQGIPLDVRSAQVKLDRPDFTLNGTSCDPLAFAGQLVSTLGQAAPLSERFQLGECTGLPFKPKLAIRLSGGTKRGAHPALKATLQMPAGGANIAKASVALPHSEFLDQAHIGTVCTRVQFAAAECPAASVYGRATATSPLVGYPLTGPAYLRSSSNKLPDLVVALHGPPSQPIEVDAVARIDSVKGGIRSTFEGVPDLPVSSFTLEMEGGRKGLLQNSTSTCKGTHKATAEFDGQNGKAADLAPALKNAKCAKAKKKAKRQRRAQRVAR
jgi:hypothetical protein